MIPRLVLRACGALLLAPLASAAVVTSNEADCHAGTGRIFSVDANTVLRCLQAGPGNINGNNAADAGFIASGWSFVDSSSGSGGAHDGWLGGSLLGGLSGQFQINPLAWTTYDRIAIGFKSGVAQADPDWAIFELADHTTSGLWSIRGSNQALSHAILYGFGAPPQLPPPPQPFQPVSEPPIGALVWVLPMFAAAYLARARRIAAKARN